MIAMIAMIATLALLCFAIAALVNLARRDGRKVLSALAGHSWAAEAPLALCPITIRFTASTAPPRRVRARPQWRAAA